jgi:hypothetical protein
MNRLARRMNGWHKKWNLLTKKENNGRMKELVIRKEVWTGGSKHVG